MIELGVPFLIAGVGVGVFMLFDLPLPWLLGPIFSCLVAALAGLKMRGIKPLNDAMRTILGVAVGATLTPAVLATLPALWATLLLVPLMVFCIGLLGVPYFQKFWGYDFPTAYYSAMPGGLQDMMVFGEEAGGNIRTLSLVHATRVLVIVVALPFLLSGIWEASLTDPPGEPVASVPNVELLLMVFCAMAGWWIAHRIGMFGASILGPLLMTAMVTVAGFIQHRPPAEAIWAAQFFIGMTVGTKYAGITWAEVKRDVSSALGFCAILVLLTLIFVELVYEYGLAPGMEALLAFAPGGQAELTVLAIIVGADVAFVAIHHMLRIFVVILGAPIAAKFVGPRLPN